MEMDRREFLRAGLGVAVTAIGAGAALTASGCSSPDKNVGQGALTITDGVTSDTVQTLQVSADQIVEATSFAQSLLEDTFVEKIRYQLPRGCNLYNASAKKALALVPIDEGNDLVFFSLLDLDTGVLDPLCRGAVGAGSFVSGSAAAATGTTGATTGNTTSTASASASASASAPPIHPAAILYDGRASDTALIWTELDLSDQGWQVYAASLKGATLGTPQLLDQGSSDYEVPLICVSGSKAYWSVMPNAGGAAQYENSYLKAAVLGEFDAEQAAGHETTAPQTTPADTVTAALQRPPYVVYTSHGRMIAQPLATQGILSFVPRVDTNGIYYRLTALSVADDSLIASVILPQSLRVSEALYLDNSFTFSIEANYSSAGGLGQFGTYRQMDNGQWLHFGRVPTSPAMRVNEFLVLKSTLSVVGLDVANQSYCIIPPPSDTEDFGDTLAGWGESDHIVVFAQTKASSASIASATIVRVFARSASNSS